MLEEKYLCISYFDEKIGPNILYCKPQKPDDIDFPDLTKLLEFNDTPGTFLFAFRRYQSINHIFYIKSKMARGGMEMLMISFLVRTSFFKHELGDVFNYLNEQSEILEKLAMKLTTLPSFIQVLHLHKKDPNEADLAQISNELKIDFLSLFNAFFEDLALDPEINIITKDAKITKKIYIIGQQHAGKSIFLKNIEASQFYRQKDFTLSTRILGVLLENVKIPSPRFNLEEPLDLSSIQGFIYLFRDATEENFNRLRKDLEVIMENAILQNKKTPLAILQNIMAGESSIDSNVFLNKITQTKEQATLIPLYFRSLNILKDDNGILNALKWLIFEIL